MRHDDKLRCIIGTSDDLKQECKLSLRRKRCFRLVQKIYAISLKAVLRQGKKALSMRLFMEMLGFSSRSSAILILGSSHIVKALRSEEIPPSGLMEHKAVHSRDRRIFADCFFKNATIIRI